MERRKTKREQHSTGSHYDGISSLCYPGSSRVNYEKETQGDSWQCSSSSSITHMLGAAYDMVCQLIGLGWFGVALDMVIVKNSIVCRAAHD